MLRLLSAAAVAVALSVQPAAAQQTEDEIVVTGQRIHDALHSFVTELAAPPQREDQLSRWDRHICPLVAGLPARQAQFIADRVSQRAYQVDLQPGEAGCSANLLIFVTPDADRLAQNFYDQYKDVLAARTEANMATAGTDALDAFVASDKPVRWWHVSQTATSDGQLIRNSDAQTSSSGGIRNASVARVRETGRLARPTRQDFNRAIIIVDARLASGVQFEALADYIAMASLAQLDPNANTSEAPTILNLFDDRTAGRSPPSTMTDWDVSYLHGLYDATRNARNSHAQEADITRRMEREVTSAPNDGQH